MPKRILIIDAVSILILYFSMSIQMHKNHVYTLQMNMHFTHGYTYYAGLEYVQFNLNKINSFFFTFRKLESVI